MKPIKIVHKHSADCVYRDPDVSNGDGSRECWYLSDINVNYMGHHRVMHAVCNDPDCKGQVRVNVSLFEDYIYSQTGGPE